MDKKVIDDEGWNFYEERPYQRPVKRNGARPSPTKSQMIATRIALGMDISETPQKKIPMARGNRRPPCENDPQNSGGNA